MATTNTVPELKSEYLKMVPEFSGEPELLPRFLSICEKLVMKFYNVTNLNDFQNDYLMDSIIAKIKGDAQRNISSCVISSWNDLKNALINTYADKRDVHTLVIEMCALKQTSESAFEFFNKIQKMINLQTSYVVNHNTPGAEYIKKFILDLGLRTFLRGLKEPLGSLMRTKNPKDLNDALNILTNDFQIDTTRKNQDNTQRYVPPMMNNNKSFQKASNQTQYSGWNQQRQFSPNQSNQNQNNSYRNNNWRNNNNNSNYNNQNNKTQNNQNVWTRPSTQPLPKATPMSISTGATRNQLNNIEACDDQQYPVEEQQFFQPDQDVPDQMTDQCNQEQEAYDNQNFWFGASESTEH
ncbi:myb-like protein P [Diaphorina citri]|uniref:Myb-like protein P n=1 Tax=Diaphorina citri TaxID=121845 RepID=A0A1S3DNN6_DIACI|nr:myb-like protein P [Diaphorina citri]XP_026687291.1 myb-like protein P [Diaphorina citri]XP_026687830.1 myb-like protein P [Diaphorina citri]XP_026687847.1 myb-like protein P [Diaphorina citri]XP_026689086.1 myb-like protein P [Diaphorina citri]KAI5707738.1 hypothetical protein M8J77_008776 [Diaphorina citri]KAI5708090.1 hypothetical protein M8J77_016253 [Diaphorina citri]KAI5708315.1 hypothetical protein M8J77_020448 [Diaphorina citri]KAI5708326.1 hypothetical protein M8J77_020590 [Diap